MTISIVGAGFAGLSLAEAMHHRGEEFTVFGRTETNTPPNAIVHLFAGRSFARSQLEVLAFERAIDFWTDHPFATRTDVLRHVPDGSRLQSSKERTNVPDAYRPRGIEREWVEYRPAFVIDAWDYLKSIRSELGDRVVPKYLNRDKFPTGKTVLALGYEIANFIDAEWSQTGRQLVAATCEEPIDRIVIGEVTGINPHIVSSWSGMRCALDGDRLPVIGWRGDEFVFAGFGSRGFFWMPYCVDVALEAISSRSNDAIPAALSVGRLP